MQAKTLRAALAAVLALWVTTSSARAQTNEPILQRSFGNTNLQLLDLSLDVLMAAGSSTASNDELIDLQGGDHDPRKRGFTLQSVETGFLGAVDPYVTGRAIIDFFIAPDGETVVELEEAYLTTLALPFHLQDYGFQLEAGQFFTPFGRLNTFHSHAWDWEDQVFTLTRFFGTDGARNPGFRINWLTPLPWYSELIFGMQNANGETMVSYLANSEVFEMRPIGGRPFVSDSVKNAGDFAYNVRWANGVDISDTWSGKVGVSGLFGANATGDDGDTQTLGADFVFKWVPLDAERGWPHVRIEGEYLYRRYHAAAFTGCAVEAPGCTVQTLPAETLHDHGFYLQGVWGFIRNWGAGLRFEYGRGSGENVAIDPTTNLFVPASPGDDPYRAPRFRFSPLIYFQPSHFTRFRLQYNYDNTTWTAEQNNHSVWFGVEFLFGAHPAHAY
jgi:hypothetical protein